MLKHVNRKPAIVAKSILVYILYLYGSVVPVYAKTFIPLQSLRANGNFLCVTHMYSYMRGQQHTPSNCRKTPKID